MKKFFQIYQIWTLSFLAIFFIACEKEIDVNVDNAEPKLVIEANLSNRAGDAKVLLTQSQNLNANTEIPKVSGAEVSIKDETTQEVFMLTETEEGVYQNPTLMGEEQKSYTLQVILPDGQTFTATDTMPVMVALDGVVVDEVDESFGTEEDEGFYEIEPQFTDIANTENYYQLIVTRGDEILDEINIFKDLGFDGLPNTQKIYIDAYPGETIHFDLHNISAAAYTYLFGLNANLEQGSATPTNPESNIEGDALGYFKAYATGESVEIVLE